MAIFPPPQQGQRAIHMRWQGRTEMHVFPGERVPEGKLPRMQVKPVVKAANGLPGPATDTIFSITDHGGAQLRHVIAQLMRASGQGVQGNKRKPVSHRIQNRVIGPCRSPGGSGPAADCPGGLGRAAGNDSPVDLVQISMGKQPGKGAGGPSRSGQDQDTGRVLVKTVHQPRPFAPGQAETVSHPVDMAMLTGSPLDGKPGRLVDGHQELVLEKNSLGNQPVIAGIG